MISDFILIVSVMALAGSLAAYMWLLDTWAPNWLRGALCAISGAFSFVTSSWAFFAISPFAIIVVGLSLWACLTGCKLVFENFNDK